MRAFGGLARRAIAAGRFGTLIDRAEFRLLNLALLGVLALLAAGQLIRPGESFAERHGGFAYSIEVTGGIDEGAQHDLERALAEAKDRHASVAIVRLDTPGGLIEATREMVKDIIAAPMPVIVYVYPSGAHAASAGLFLTLAGDVAAMAPGTNIGSATPVLRGPSQSQEQRALLERKVRNDAIAWARALAEQHDRNPRLAQRMVSEAVNLSASQARRQRLIDVVAASEGALLRELDGFQLDGPGAGKLRTAGLPIKHADIDAALVDSRESGDDSSFIRSFALILAVAFAIGLGLWALVRGRGLWRRRRWLWRRWRAERSQRQRSP